MHFATFSIAAHDRATNCWGIAVASKFLAVGAYVPYARAGVGAVATQALVNISYGERGLALLADGVSACDAVRQLTETDDGRGHRQLGVVDAHGGAATFTGDNCMRWAGGVTGDGFAIQGNILAGPMVIESMHAAYLAGGGTFATRLLAALRAGDAAGGDKRGKQSAALLVVKPNGGYGGGNDRWLDLRVDDHPQPISKLGELLALHGLYFGTTPLNEKLRLEGALLGALQTMMQRLGYYSGSSTCTNTYDAETRAALRAFSGTENLEERVDLEQGLIDPPAMGFLTERFGDGMSALPDKVAAQE